jgi:putative ABC transport system ATP-binding protein
VVEERGRGATSLVVGRGGWIRLPAPLQAAAGLGDRVEPRAVEGGLLLAPARGRGGPSGPRPQPTAVDAEATAGDRQAPGAAAEPARVELTGLSRTYRDGHLERHVLHELTHAFPPRRLTVVTGRSGSGKTTLLRLIAGLDRADAGEVTIDGGPISGRGDEHLAELRRGRMGVMAQDPAPVAFLSAQENIVLALRLRGWEQAAAARRASTVLDLVGLTERGGQRVVRLSAGEVQRLALARALAGARGLLLVDEPTSRLDEANAANVAALLARAAASEGHTVICASHDAAIVDVADELLPLE